MLTDAAIRSLAPQPKLYRKGDRDGLCLEVTPKGRKHWRFRYVFAGRARMISLGSYPIVTLAQARERCFDARRDLSAGRDPAQVKREDRAAIAQREENKFPEVGRRWLATKHYDPAQRVGDGKPFKRKTYDKAATILEGDLGAPIGERPRRRHAPKVQYETRQFPCCATTWRSAAHAQVQNGLRVARPVGILRIFPSSTAGFRYRKFKMERPQGLDEPRECAGRRQHEVQNEMGLLAGLTLIAFGHAFDSTQLGRAWLPAGKKNPRARTPIRPQKPGSPHAYLQLATRCSARSRPVSIDAAQVLADSRSFGLRPRKYAMRSALAPEGCGNPRRTCSSLMIPFPSK